MYTCLLGDYEKLTDSFGNVREYHYICGANSIAAIHVTTADKDTMYYAFTDYQHNLLALTDAAGKPYERYSYDPWGNRRSATDWTQRDTLTHHIINRGYTMHEHLDEFGLINMNGRMYDPKLACFLSPDPVLQSPDNWLNYNRYSYCFGNPLKYSDPSGFVTNTSISGQEAEAAERRAQENAKGNDGFDWSDILNLKDGHYENQNGTLVKTEDLKKFDNASDNTAYNTGTSTTKNTSAEQQQNKMTVTTPNDLNKPQDSGNLTEKAGTLVEKVNNNKCYGTAMVMNGEMSTVSAFAEKNGWKVLKGAQRLGYVGNAISIINDGFQMYNGQADKSTIIDIGANVMFIVFSLNPVTAPYAAAAGAIYCVYTLTKE